MKPFGRTPKGETVGKKQYLDEWTVMYKRLEKILDVKVRGFDPDFQVSDAEFKVSATIPMWLAVRILERDDASAKACLTCENELGIKLKYAYKTIDNMRRRLDDREN